MPVEHVPAFKTSDGFLFTRAREAYVAEIKFLFKKLGNLAVLPEKAMKPDAPELLVKEVRERLALVESWLKDAKAAAEKMAK